MNPQQNVDKNISQYDDTQLKYKTKSKLLSNLKSSGVDIYVVKGERVGDLQDIPRKIISL